MRTCDQPGCDRAVRTTTGVFVWCNRHKPAVAWPIEESSSFKQADKEARP